MYAYKVSDKVSNMENLVFFLDLPPLILQEHCKVCKPAELPTAPHPDDFILSYSVILLAFTSVKLIVKPDGRVFDFLLDIMGGYMVLGS